MRTELDYLPLIELKKSLEGKPLSHFTMFGIQIDELTEEELRICLAWLIDQNLIHRIK